MIQQLFSVLREPDPQGMDSMDYSKLKVVLSEFLQQRRYLVVLDDVWQIHAWDAFKHALPNSYNGSRILLTTCNGGIASTACIGFPNNVYTLNPLSPEESWALLCMKTFQNDSCPSQLRNVSQNIPARCEGLPLAIVAISSVLATKSQCRIDEWEMIHRSLGARLEYNDRLMSVMKILSLSYDDLPYYLKSCLLYFSIFPEGHPIQNSRLTRLLIAEGFVEGKDGMTLEEVADEYLSELIKRSLVQVVETKDERIRTCRVHDLLREMISKAREQDFAAIEKEKFFMWTKTARRVSIHNAIPSNHLRPIPSRSRSLLIFGGLDSLCEPLLSTLSSGRIRLLHVLDLEGAPLKEFPEDVASLVLLKYLSLRCTKVNSIPSSIGNLQKLVTLDMIHTQVTELPDEIVKLQKLRHLLVYRYEFESRNQFHIKYGFKSPAQIGGLQSLQKLSFLEANESCNLMSEVGRLKELRRLGIVKLQEKDGKPVCSSIAKLTILKALSVTSTKKNETIDIHYITAPPQFLQRLYLHGRLEKLPSWISPLNNLVKLIFRWSQLSDDPLSPLQHLPNLAHLELIKVYGGEMLCFQSKGFQRLKDLRVNNFENLKTMNVEMGAMPRLEKLVLKSCEQLQGIPHGIEHLTELRTPTEKMEITQRLHTYGRFTRHSGTAGNGISSPWKASKWIKILQSQALKFLVVTCE